jgi:plasmid stabilization system protein ParE
MARITATVLGLSGCLLVLICAIPAYADPFVVRVYGRTYKVDPRYPPGGEKSRVPQDVMKALPADIAGSPAFRPTHDQVLAEVEERTWIARHQLEDELRTSAVSRGARYAGGETASTEPEITGSNASVDEKSRSPEVQTLYDRHQALNLLARELRRSLDLPVSTPEAGFSRPKLSPEIEASYRDLNFDPHAAYYSFRRVKAAFRSGDVQLLARVTHYPLSITRKAKRSIRNYDQLVAAKKIVMNPRILEVAANSSFETVFVRDKGMMLGVGEIWITHNKTGFWLGALTVD